MNILYMDAYLKNWFNFNSDESLRQNMGYIRRYADRMNLAAMTPSLTLASTGYSLANRSANGAEYIVCLPSGGSVSINLSATSRTLSVEWFNPSTGQTTPGASVTGGGTRSFTAPFGGDAVLYIGDSGPRPPAAPTNLRVE
jgi:Putative collagen-binding domain of a collagenase